jgi:hypothetical protein
MSDARKKAEAIVGLIGNIANRRDIREAQASQVNSILEMLRDQAEASAKLAGKRARAARLDGTRRGEYLAVQLEELEKEIRTEKGAIK